MTQKEMKRWAYNTLIEHIITTEDNDFIKDNEHVIEYMKKLVENLK